MRLIIIIAFLLCLANSKLACKSETGAPAQGSPVNDLPRFAIIKPREPKRGVETDSHYYWDDNFNRFQAYYARFLVEESPLYNTLKQITQNPQLQIVAFNDDPPTAYQSIIPKSKVTFYKACGPKTRLYKNRGLYKAAVQKVSRPLYAHSKGFIVFDPTEDSGFFIQHTLPKFPSWPDPLKEWHDNYETPPQSIFCMTLNSKTKRQIEKSLAFEFARIYYYTLLFNPLVQDIKGTRLRYGSQLRPVPDKYFKLLVTPRYQSQTQGIRIFSKSPFSGERLEDQISESYMPGQDIELYFRSYVVTVPDSDFITAVREIELPERDSMEAISIEGNDHSKWIVSSDQYKLACFCDLNRQKAHSKRGGSCFCPNSSNLWEALYNTIVVPPTQGSAS